VADGDRLGVGVLLAGAFAVFVGAAAGLDFSVRVGAAVALAEVVPEPVGSGVEVPVVEVPVVALAVVAGGGLDVVDAGVVDELLGVADGLVGVADGLVGVADGEVGVGEGDGLGGAAGSCSGSHD
jgi:hypothetical protein